MFNNEEIYFRFVGTVLVSLEAFVTKTEGQLARLLSKQTLVNPTLGAI